MISVKVKLRGTVADTNGYFKQSQLVDNIILNEANQSTLYHKGDQSKLSAVYMVYTITNKDTNPRRIWKR